MKRSEVGETEQMRASTFGEGEDGETDRQEEGAAPTRPPSPEWRSTDRGAAGGGALPAPGLLLEEPLDLPRGEVGTGPALAKGSELSLRAQSHPDRSLANPEGCWPQGCSEATRTFANRCLPLWALVLQVYGGPVMGLLPLSGSAEASPPRSIKAWALLAPAEGAWLFRFLKLSQSFSGKRRAERSTRSIREVGVGVPLRAAVRIRGSKETEAAQGGWARAGAC